MYSFLARHPEISQRKAQRLNEARAIKLNPTIVADYFKKLEDLLNEFSLIGKPERIFNLDEKGIQLKLHKSPMVMAARGSKNVHIRAAEHGENVTVVACVNAIGNAIPPIILFKGKNRGFRYLYDRKGFNDDSNLY